MAKPHPFFLLLCFVLAAATATASALSPPLTHAYQELLKLKVASSRAILHKATPNTDEEKAAALLFGNYNDFWELCLEQDQQRYSSLLEAQEQRLAILEKSKGRSAWADFAAAEISLHIGMSELLFGNKLAAAWDLRKAYLRYRTNLQRWPGFIPNRKNLGMLQVMIGSVPDQYQWFLSIVGLKGSVREGMANLQSAADTPTLFQDEAKLLRAVVLHALVPEKAPLAVTQLTEMVQARPDNLLFLFAAMHLLKKTNQGEAAIMLYERRPVGKQYSPFPFLHHMVADLYLYRGDYAASAAENNRFLQQHRGKHYLKSAHYKLYLAYLLSRNPSAAKQHLKQIAEAGIRETEEDRYAARYAEENAQPVLPLLKARLHADGGYYDQALQDLKQPLSPSDTSLAVRAEYLYRKARVYHGLKDLQEAVSLYRQTIVLASATELYFAPNAALQLGYIYQQADQPEVAKAYFRQALRYKGHPYKNSIDAKAKLALSSF
ncbi:tetratricopeptide repeat protein [Pontibacter sp. E15-1]|uniref:tetratricopeptide repeat protein n=1 Tax=Pontibacter sp. E15-1 TaxID=2919918 RepID=UPI001F4FB7CB|nr:tetratricopeptide repeat protein [Pontibacter sp. E15-1]MCJ8163515.1 tetratricopeptide repeat protein [Pontibacter sp. E15-1]